MEFPTPTCKGEFDALVDEFRSTRNLSLVQAVYAVLEILHARAHSQPGAELACGNHCAHCCYQAVIVAESEWRVIQEVLDNDNTLFNRLREQIWQSVQAWRSYAQHNRSRLTVINQVGADWAGQPCMFLDRQTQECQIYEARPYTCRVYASPVRCQNNTEPAAKAYVYPWSLWAYETILYQAGAPVLASVHVWAGKKLKNRL